jgi:hypothetical protein
MDGHTRPTTNLWKGLQCRIISKTVQRCPSYRAHKKKFYRVETLKDLRKGWTILGTKFMFFFPASFVWNIFCSDKQRALFIPQLSLFTSRLYSSCVWPVWRMGYVNTKNEPAGSCNRYLCHIKAKYLASYASELHEVVTLPEILCGNEVCNRTPTVSRKVWK